MSAAGAKIRIPAAVLALGILLVCCPCIFALDTALDVSQYAHTAWKVREGFTKGEIHAIAQTPDGYLWLGTEFGLVRFDGARAVPWEPPPGQQLPASQVWSLLAAHDGTLWIGTRQGLASWKDGKLTSYPGLSEMAISALVEDRDGTVWAGALAFPPPGRICAIQNSRVQCSGDVASLGPGVLSLYLDSKGNLWASVAKGLWRWKPGPPAFISLPDQPEGASGMAEDTDGALLIGLRAGAGKILRLMEGKLEPYTLPATVPAFRPHRFLRDRDGSLWISTENRGLVHLGRGRVDVFAQPDGLSGNNLQALYEDREGNVWAATSDGLDRFRSYAVATYGVNQGLSEAVVGSVMADRDGSVWIGTFGGLDKWNGQISVFRKGNARAQRGGVGNVTNNPDALLDGHAPTSMFQDSRRRIWVPTSFAFGYLENERYIHLKSVPAGQVQAMAEDRAGNLWIANQNVGLIRLSRQNEIQLIPWASLGHKVHGNAMVADPAQGGLWIGFFDGGVAYFQDGKVRATYSSADGLGGGIVNGLQLDPDGTLWAATAGGLSRFRDGRFATLTSKNGLPCDAVHWMAQDEAQSFWLYMPCGLVRVERAEMDAWIAAVGKDKNAKPTVRTLVFDIIDGVRTRANAGGYTPHAAKAGDGKIWFHSPDGLSVVDPRHLPLNKLAPPVHVQQIIADHKTYAALSGGNGDLRLPPLIQDLEIDYTALSLVAPEKVHFRFKLEGQDQDWREVVNQREVQYSNLGPGSYRFRVTACNNSGVWNEQGDALDFFIAPAYYQTTWFRFTCVTVLALLLFSLYRLRLRQVAQQFNIRLEERVSERTRIARDLHDTLLQSFHGLLLRFQTVSNLLPPGDHKQRLDDAIDQAAQAITEGRDAVQGLRSSTVETNDLASAIRAIGEELAADPTNHNRAAFRVQVECTPRDLHPILRDEVYRIAAEALRNAFNHAQAHQIEVEIRYDERQFRLRVRDDGKGIDTKLLTQDEPPGHFGLRGMRERAELMGGKLTVWSELDSGTEVELSAPASIAYARSPARRFSWFSGKSSAKDTELKS